MPTLTQSDLVTAEKFVRMPQPEDGSQLELVEGVVISMPPPSFAHGVCCNRIGRKVGNFVEDHSLGFVTSNDSGVILSRKPDTVRGPDVAFWSKRRMPAAPSEGYAQIAPDLVVEVLSPHDVFPKVLRKVQQYLKADVLLIWVVVPEDRSVTVYRPGRDAAILTEEEILTGEDVLLGFECLVSQLFA